MRCGAIRAWRLGLLLLLNFVPAAFAQNFRSALILAPYSLDFGRVLAGATSNSHTVMVFNNGESAQEISGISITGDFAETDNCPKAPATLAAGADCEIHVTFKPSTLASHSGTLTVSEAPSGIQLNVTLEGVGTAGRPTVSISNSSLTFPEEQPGVQSPPQTVTVKNTGTEMLMITNVEVKGDFMALPASTCINMGSEVSPGATCSVVVVFVPLGTGARSGEVVVADNADDSPQKVGLSGIGK